MIFSKVWSIEPKFFQYSGKASQCNGFFSSFQHVITMVKENEPPNDFVAQISKHKAHFENHFEKALATQMRLFVACSIEKEATNEGQRRINESIQLSTQVLAKILKKRKEDGLCGLSIKWKMTAALSTSKYVQKLDEILGTDDSIVEISYFTSANKEVEEDIMADNADRMFEISDECESFKASLYSVNALHGGNLLSSPINF